MDFNAQIQTISSEQMDALFEGTPSVKDLKVGDEKTDSSEPAKRTDNSVIPVLDMETFGEEPVETPEDDKGTDDKKPNEPPVDDKKVEEKKVEVSDEQKAQTSEILKSTVNYLIDKGIWKDFDEKDNIDFTDEVYAELSAKQAEVKVSELFDELIDSTGSYGKAIISHIKNGGNPDEIIDLFKEQKQMQSIDINSEGGQKAIIEQYYSNVVGWSKQKIDEFIAFKEGKEDGLESEAKEVQDKFDGLYSKQLQQIEQEQRANELKVKREQEEYIKTLSKEIDTFDNFTDKDKKLVKDSLLKFNKKLDNGTKINDFYVKFYEIQNDPKQYIELVHFIMDKEGYKEKVKSQLSTKAVEKSWNFVKGNGSITKKGSDQHQNNDTTKTSKIDFSGLFKK